MPNPAPAPSTSLYDPTSGAKLAFASPDEATAAVAAGKAVPRKTQRVPVKLADGTTGTVEGHALGDALKGGAMLLSEEDHRKSVLEARYGTGVGSLKEIQHTLAVSGTAGLRGASAALGAPGLSDKAMIEAMRLLHGEKGAASARRTLSEMAEAHPTQTLVNEILGTAAASSGPLGEVGISGLGGAAERAALEALGGKAATGLGSRVATKAVGMAARGAVESALFTGAQEYDESILGDHDLAAQKLFTAMGMGALVGAGGGAVLGGGGVLAKEGLARAAGVIAPKLREAAGEQMWKALSPSRPLTEEAQRRAGGTAAVGRTVLEEIGQSEAGLVKTATSRATPEELHPLITAAVSRVGQEIGDKIATSEATVAPQRVMQAFHDVIAPLEGKALYEPIVRSLDEARASVFEKLGMITPAGDVIEGGFTKPIPVQSLIEQTRAIGDIAYKESKALDPKLRVEYLRTVYGALREVEAEAFDKAAAEAKGPAAAEIKELYTKYQRLKLAEKAVEKSTSAYATNRNFGMSDYLTAVGAMASGHPLAAPVAAVGHKMLRERGNATLAVGLDKLADLGVMRELTQRLDERADRAVVGFMKSDTAPRARVGKLLTGGDDEEGSLRQRYRSAIKKTAALTSDATLPEASARRMAGLGRYAPNVSASLSTTLARALTFLRGKMPDQSIPSQLPAYGMQTVPHVPDVDMSRFLRYARAATSPATVLDDLERGRVSPEAVEALKEVAPAVYAELQTRVVEKLNEASAKEQIPYEKRLRLAVLFQAPADETMQPSTVKALQSGFSDKTPADGGAEKPQGSPPKRPVQKLAASERLTTDRLGESSG